MALIESNGAGKSMTIRCMIDMLAFDSERIIFHEAKAISFNKK